MTNRTTAALMLCAPSFAFTTTTALADFVVDESLFRAQTTVVAENAFDDVLSGPVAELSYSAGAYSYTLAAEGPASGSLSNHEGLVSTESHLDGIRISFTGAEVFAFGANLWSVGPEGETRGGYLTIELADGTSSLFSATGPHNFRAFVSETAIESVFIDMPDGTGDEEGRFWVGLDNLLVGASVPAPGSLGVLAGFAICAPRRRR